MIAENYTEWKMLFDQAFQRMLVGDILIRCRCASCNEIFDTDYKSREIIAKMNENLLCTNCLQKWKDIQTKGIEKML